SIEDGLPIFVAGKIVVGDEKLIDALRQIGAHYTFHVVGVAIPRLPPLDVDDGAEAALEWAASAGIEGGFQHVAPDHVAWQDWDHLPAEVGQVLQEVIDWLQLLSIGVAQQLPQAVLRFSREKSPPLAQSVAQLGGQIGQHGDTPAHVKAADNHSDARLAKLPRQVQRARKLVALHPGQQHQPAPAAGFDPADDTAHGDYGMGLVVAVDDEFHAQAQHLALLHVQDKGVQACKRVGGNEGPDPLDDITVVVVMGRLDDFDEELGASLVLGRHWSIPRKGAEEPLSFAMMAYTVKVSAD